MPGGSSGDQALAMLWDQPDAGGPSGSGHCLLIGTGANIRYDRLTRDDLWNGNLISGGSPTTSSVSLFAPLTGATGLILCRAEFYDQFFFIENRTGGRLDLNLTDANFNNLTWSAISVHTAMGPELPA